MTQKQLKDELMNELTGRILPFWSGMQDDENGGFYGQYTYNHQLVKDADKGGILHSRILWFFSRAYELLGDPEILRQADHAYEFIRDVCIDKEKDGMFWSVTFDGKPADTTKHTYNQAFAIYGLSQYYLVTKKKEALDLAMNLYHLVESKCRDEQGYLEAFDRKFKPAGNEKLSENGVEASRTMNTTLHVFEAYTVLFRASGNPEVKEKMEEMLDTFLYKIYNPMKKRQEVFFDNKWNSIIDLYSYGHDIETTWLVDLGLDVLGDSKHFEEFAKVNDDMVEQLYVEAYNGHSFYDECCKGIQSHKKIWWVQSETMVGYYQAFTKHPKQTKYLDVVMNVWEFIKNNLIDTRPDSEWLGELNENNEPNREHDIVGMWKCPYHNGRMCIELIERISLAIGEKI